MLIADTNLLRPAAGLLQCVISTVQTLQAIKNLLHLSDLLQGKILKLISEKQKAKV
jgi:hypothetical protein